MIEVFTENPVAAKGEFLLWWKMVLELRTETTQSVVRLRRVRPLKRHTVSWSAAVDEVSVVRQG